MNKKIIFLKIFLLFMVPSLSVASSIDLNVPTENFKDLAIWIYNTIIFISALAAFAMIVYGGIEYLVSAGNPEKMRSGMDKIQSAIIGVLIVLTSYLILNMINPDLLEIKLPNLTPQS